jgi:hypothetical protein
VFVGALAATTWYMQKKWKKLEAPMFGDRVRNFETKILILHLAKVWKSCKNLAKLINYRCGHFVHISFRTAFLYEAKNQRLHVHVQEEEAIIKGTDRQNWWYATRTLLFQLSLPCCLFSRIWHIIMPNMPCTVLPAAAPSPSSSPLPSSRLIISSDVQGRQIILKILIQ